MGRNSTLGIASVCGGALEEARPAAWKGLTRRPDLVYPSLKDCPASWTCTSSLPSAGGPRAGETGCPGTVHDDVAVIHDID
jgi:hypothetical protein